MLIEYLKGLRAGESGAGLRQSGAIPYSIVDGRVVFLLVTSRRTGRWIFPKGAIPDGMSAWDSAATEAMEEAGVVGKIGADVIGTYKHFDKDRAVLVDLYPLLMVEQFADWQEKRQRHRHWALLAETRRLIGNKAISDIAVNLHEQLVGATAASN